MFLLIGSNAMQMIALRNEFTAFTRRADAKIALLKEVIGRVQKGEEVDVKGLLGTGDPEKEKEWEQVIQEIEEEDRLWQSKARQRQQKQMSKTPDPKQEKNDSASGVSPGSKVTQPLSGHTQETTTATTRKVPRAFY
ncbi:MAG: hypothetical protein L6R41_000858 [Letrouitia leprolyta]|nr:MAG: hypothetical protein L6R41_000858 [Letrouitia leprolyta]